MITKIEIKRFQSLGNITLETGPLTVIYGASDVGKSALIRALRALATNRYPKDHVTIWSDKDHSSISVETDDLKIIAQKGGGINRYGLRTETTKQMFRKVGSHVPEDVTQALGWSDNTISSQFDPLYLVAETGAQRAKVLGTLSNFATLIEAVRLADVYTRRYNQEQRVHSETIKETTEAIEQESRHLSETILRRDQLSDLASRLEALYAELDRIGNIIGIFEHVDRWQHDVDTLKAKVIPDTEQVPELLQQLADHLDLQHRATEIAQKASEASRYHKEATDAYRAAQSALRAFCDEHPICPVCGKEGWHGS